MTARATAAAPSEVVVRMGELAVSADPGDVLVALALGSCVGLAMADPFRGIAGLAHVMLPAGVDGGEGPRGQAARYAGTAVPTLLGRLLRLGAMRHRLVVSVAGGAQMFSGTADEGIGRRNQEAVRAALAHAGLGVHAACTGGALGRSMRLEVATGTVVVRPAGGRPVQLTPSEGSVTA